MTHYPRSTKWMAAAVGITVMAALTALTFYSKQQREIAMRECIILTSLFGPLPPPPESALIYDKMNPCREFSKEK